MQDKRSYVYGVFQSVASGYDKANARISLGLHRRWKGVAVRTLCAWLPDFPRILDIGCGTGDMLLLFAQESPNATLVGLDFSPNMLAQAQARCASMEGLSLVQGDAQALPFDDESFDGVSIAFALRNTTDYDAVLAEARRVLRPGGALTCIDSFVPSCVVVRPFYHLYFSVLMPLLGGGIRHWRQYRWLSTSTSQFITVRQLCDLMRSVGYDNLQCKTFMFGACACVSGKRTS
jgi:demethylmenaquinone methyltransferase/2-methoxy-6-polyprenyl-1,4-benzoquinol methylase